jgi:hypothetical protein
VEPQLSPMTGLIAGITITMVDGIEANFTLHKDIGVTTTTAIQFLGGVQVSCNLIATTIAIGIDMKLGAITTGKSKHANTNLELCDESDPQLLVILRLRNS